MNGAPVIADLHVHWHSYYDSVCLLRDVVPRFRRLGGPSSVAVLCWTEASRCRAFDRLAAGGGPWPVTHTASNGAALWVGRDDPREGVWILRGQQILSAERIEILTVGVRDDSLEGCSADDIIARLRDVGSPALIPWAPGKWCGRRGRLVRELVTRWPAEFVLLVDSSLRPRGWPLPVLLREWLSGGGRHLAGSDPLEFPGEEDRIGTYATRFETVLDASDPVAALIAMLRDVRVQAMPVGLRAGPAAIALRIALHMWRVRRRSVVSDVS